jgi:iron-sulfur cluster insertion protein
VKGGWDYFSHEIIVQKNYGDADYCWTLWYYILNMTTSELLEPLIFTTEAANKVKSILKEMAEEENDPTLANQKLRIAIKGGGCSGFKYEFEFTHDQNDDDIAVEKNGVTLLVDPISFGYLEDATISYKEDAEGEEFVITNPNANSTCGCGSSFSA